MVNLLLSQKKQEMLMEIPLFTSQMAQQSLSLKETKVIKVRKVIRVNVVKLQTLVRLQLEIKTAELSGTR